ncbi:hypothetical protein CsSME_00003253 [Camellia sinensis var. sinensis]
MAREGISALIGVGDIRLVVRVSQHRPFPWGRPTEETEGDTEALQGDIQPWLA